MRYGALAVAALALAACVPGNSDTPMALPAPLSPSAIGLQPAGSPLEISFGRAREGVIETVSRLLGAGPVEITRQDECGAGPVTAARWSNGLTLNFTDGDFRGWVLNQPGLRTAQGLSVGQPRDALGAVQTTETSLGSEFRKGGEYGLLGEDGSAIDLIWSGTTCFFR
ncbi:hypothetical protein E2K80_18015 [Rhodophyticola sp. CCM32]|uniref:hypothetical protein n=1 Tax=Rhodophyticola sp. CCM32 TaxID=2916397 RepID=UPI00107F328A|nr:hypothetical protein [Rhodophyticola sp. CCM32]QBY02408.1 hypothetical protein E2K80_18015 [Rhodophyticola sp. CCM32]